MFSPSSRWPETTSLWDILGSCGTGHSHSSGHSCCPGSYSPSKKKKGNSVWVREFLLVLVREISAFSSIVVSDSIIFQKSIVEGVLLAVSLCNCIGWFFVGIFWGVCCYWFFPIVLGCLSFLQNDSTKNTVEKMLC